MARVFPLPDGSAFASAPRWAARSPRPFYRAYRRAEDPGAGAVRRYFANDLAACGRRDGACAGHGGQCLCLERRRSGWRRRGWRRRMRRGGGGRADEPVRYPYIGFALLQNVAFAPPPDLDRSGPTRRGAGAAREEDARAAAPVLGRLLGTPTPPTRTTPRRPIRRARPQALRSDAAGRRTSRWAGDAHGLGRENDGCEEGLVIPSGRHGITRRRVTPGTRCRGGALAAIGRARSTRGWYALRRVRDTDPECRIVPTTALTPIDARVAVSTALAFGGTNAVLVLGRGDR